MKPDDDTSEHEWTVRFDNMIYAGEIFVTIISDKENRDRVVAMHNLALAAEDYGLKVAVPNMKTDTQTAAYDIKHVTFHNLLSVVMGTVSNQTGESFDKAMLRTQSADEIYRRHNALKAQADKLAEALREIFKQCACVHKYWGEGYNQEESDAAVTQASKALAEYEAAQ